MGGNPKHRDNLKSITWDFYKAMWNSKCDFPLQMNEATINTGSKPTSKATLCTCRNMESRSPPTQYSKTNHRWAEVSYLKSIIEPHFRKPLSQISKKHLFETIPQNGSLTQYIIYAK